MDADGDIGDIGRQGDLAGAGDGDGALRGLGLDGDVGWTAGARTVPSTNTPMKKKILVFMENSLIV